MIDYYSVSIMDMFIFFLVPIIYYTHSNVQSERRMCEHMKTVEIIFKQDVLVKHKCPGQLPIPKRDIYLDTSRNILSKGMLMCNITPAKTY